MTSAHNPWNRSHIGQQHWGYYGHQGPAPVRHVAPKCEYDPNIYWDFYLVRHNREVAIQWVGKDYKPTKLSQGTWKTEKTAEYAGEDLIRDMKRAGLHDGRNFSPYGIRLTPCPMNNDPMRIRDNWDADWRAAVNYFTDAVKSEEPVNG
jgi:hypothetical protein